MKIFGWYERVPRSFVSIFCNRVDVKNPKESPFYIFGTVTHTVQKSHFLKSSKSPPSPYFIFCNKLEFQKAQRVPPSTILTKPLRFFSLRYSAVFGHSRLVIFQIEKIQSFDKCRSRPFSLSENNLGQFIFKFKLNKCFSSRIIIQD